jgi:ubiquinone/menaquinone biosynthesis C-methylase UbiE
LSLYDWGAGRRHVLMIHGQEAIRDAYRDENVARDYVDRRFREPLGAMLHALQLARLREVIGALQPTRVLEIAPGPARLTLDLAADLPQGGTLVDASREMLTQARARLVAVRRSSWRLVQGDAFQLPFRGAFDLVYTFRLIRHFDDADRARLYSGIARLLRPGGVLVFDAVNAELARTLREHAGAACHHYDALLTPGRIVAELETAGFTRIQLVDVQRHYPVLYQLQVLVAPRSRWLARTAMAVVARIPGGRPLEWIVTCERR